MALIDVEIVGQACRARVHQLGVAQSSRKPWTSRMELRQPCLPAVLGCRYGIVSQIAAAPFRGSPGIGIELGIGQMAQTLSIGLHPKRWWGSYCTALDTKPLRIKAATAAVGFTLGDLMAQLATKPKGERFKCDLLRTVRLAVYGGLIGGPVGHFWYNYLDQVGLLATLDS